MGEARKKRAQTELLGQQRAQLLDVVEQVSHALRRLMVAASASVGGDCYAHAELGRVLLADQGLEFKTKVGFAAWRVGSGHGDVLAHVPQKQSHLPPGAEMGFAYHAWLESDKWLVDFTTYQLRRKGLDLDAADGGHTSVDWCPEYLLLPRVEVNSYRTVARAPGPGLAYYEAQDELTAKMAGGHLLDEEDLAAARLIFRNPEMKVLGPNMMVAPD